MYPNNRSLFTRPQQQLSTRQQNVVQQPYSRQNTVQQSIGQQEKPVLVVITADTCGGCVMFKQRVWQQLKQRIQQSGKVQLVEINLPTVRDRIPSQYPTGLQKWVGWYPTLALFTPSSWKSGGQLQGSVFNGFLEGDKIKMVPQNQARAMTVEDIMDWIDREIASPTFVQGPAIRRTAVVDSRTVQPSNTANVANVYSGRDNLGRRNIYPRAESSSSESYSSTSRSSRGYSSSRSYSEPSTTSNTTSGSSTIRMSRPKFRGIVYSNTNNMNAY